MDKIKLNDIDFSKLQKLNDQGTKSTTYTDGQKCIKILGDLHSDEREGLKRKLMDMDGISIDGVIMPDGIIVNGDRLEGVVTDYFKDSVNFLRRFGSTMYVSCEEMFKAVKQASLILRDIHSNGIIYQDLSFENILIDKDGNVKYCDIDGCYYNEIQSPYISVLLKRFMLDFRHEKLLFMTKNMDRISLILAFIELVYGKELQKLSKKRYHSLSDKLQTLENCREYANILINRGGFIPKIPYVDELIDENDYGYINREAQLGLIRRLVRR